MRRLALAAIGLVLACSDATSVDHGMDGEWNATKVVTVNVSEEAVPGAAVSMMVPCYCTIRLWSASLRIDGTRYTEEMNVYYEFNGTVTHSQSTGRGTATQSGDRVTLVPDEGFHAWSEATRSGTIVGRRLTVDMGLRLWIYER